MQAFLRDNNQMHANNIKKKTKKIPFVIGSIFNAQKNIDFLRNLDFHEQFALKSRKICTLCAR